MSASVSCIICKEILISDVAAGPCGHMFHNKCIKQWIPKSSTCPQCRAKVTGATVSKLYPTFTDEVVDDVNELQAQLEKVTCKLKEKEEKCESLTSQLTKTEASLEKTQQIMYENTLRDMKIEASLVAVTQQAKYLKEENKKVKQLQKENTALKEKLEVLHGMQIVLDGTQKDVEEMTKSYNDLKTVATFASALKRALSDTEKEKSKLIAKVKLLQKDLQTEKDNHAAALKKLVAFKDVSNDDSLENIKTSPLLKKASPRSRNIKRKQKEDVHVETEQQPKKRKLIPVFSDTDSDCEAMFGTGGKDNRPKRGQNLNNDDPELYLQVKQGWLGAIMNKKSAPKFRQNRMC